MKSLRHPGRLTASTTGVVGAAVMLAIIKMTSLAAYTLASSGVPLPPSELGLDRDRRFSDCVNQLGCGEIALR